MGASDNEQLPMITEVTPCCGIGSQNGSQNNEGSKCVWLSMKPGVTTASPASSSVSPSTASDAPTSTITPSRTRTSARTPGAPVPSTTVPPRTTYPLMGASGLRGRRR